jgi:excinuclease UvrABC nuclease subunit
VLCDTEVGRVPSDIPGVYLLHVFRPSRGLYDVFYAGNAVDLRARLAQHMRSASTSPDVRWVRCKMTLYFSAAPVVTPAERVAVETGLIRMLRPPYNRQVPRRAAIYPNLPPLTLVSFLRRP